VPTLRSCFRAALIAPLISAVFTVTGYCGIRKAGKYSGVVIFDRWDGCHLYSGAYLMEVSEKVKEALRPFSGQAMSIDAKDVEQPMNPGDGLITRLEVLGPAPDPISPGFGRPPIVEGLSLRVISDFREQGGYELIVELRNTGDRRREIDTTNLAPTLLAKKQGLECFTPSDGPSYAAVTRTNIDFLHSHPAGDSCLIDGKGRTTNLWLLPGVAISPRFDLNPGQSIEVPLRFELSAGEYQFLAGYGGGVHEARVLASDLLSFDVDEAGRPHLVGSTGTAEPVRRPRRAGTVCGYVILEDGSPAANAKVFLWAAPIAKSEPRAANTTVTNRDGVFQMESVLEGQYTLSAVRVSAHTVLTGASGDRRLADAEVLSLPNFREGCSLQLTIRAQPSYTVHGRTQAGDPAAEPRTARLILKKGDAFPFESIAVVQGDGHYEFRDVPAGRYQFFAGWTGAGFDVKSDIEDLNVDIKWPDKNIGRNGGATPPNEISEAAVISAFLQLQMAQSMYASRYHAGFAPSLNVLGPPPDWSRATADRAGLVDSTMAGLQPGDDGTHFSQGNYRVTYIPTPDEGSGKIAGYFLSARPIGFGKNRARSFLMDEGGVIHVTEADRPATLDDPAEKQ
jgi:hypothetical protein